MGGSLVGRMVAGHMVVHRMVAVVRIVVVPEVGSRLVGGSLLDESHRIGRLEGHMHFGEGPCRRQGGTSYPPSYL